MEELLPQSSPEHESKVNVIDTVKTPLGFFVLVVLIVEAIMGVTATFSVGSAQTYLVIGMIALIFFLVAIVAGIAIFRPVALYGLPAAPKVKPAETLYTDLVERLPARARRHLDFIEQCHAREIDALKREHEQAVKGLKKQIRQLKRENKSLEEWFEVLKWGGVPEEL